jgi:hypothetical protein
MSGGCKLIGVVNRRPLYKTYPMDSCGRCTIIYILVYRSKKCLKKLDISARINARLRRIAGIDSLSEHKYVVDEQDDI